MSGVVAGPAMGHFYTGQHAHAIAGIVVRGALLAAMVHGLNSNCPSGSGSCDNSGADAASFALVAAMLIDLVSAPSSASQFNADHAHVSVMPLSNGVQTRFGVGVTVPVR